MLGPSPQRQREGEVASPSPRLPRLASQGHIAATGHRSSASRLLRRLLQGVLLTEGFPKGLGLIRLGAARRCGAALEPRRAVGARRQVALAPQSIMGRGNPRAAGLGMKWMIPSPA